MDLTIVAGECNEYELPLAPGGPLGFALLDADGQDLGGDVHLTVTAANGTTVLDATVHCDEFQNWPTGHNRNSYWYFAPFGDLHVVAEVVGSVRCETKIQFSRTGGLELPHALKLH
jgi:hypothetical protein